LRSKGGKAQINGTNVMLSVGRNQSQSKDLRYPTLHQNQSMMADPQNENAQSARPSLRLGILLSGRGSNFVAIAKSIREGRLHNVEIAVVISNVADAAGVAAARELNLPTAIFVSRGRPRTDHDAELIACLREHNVYMVCLAGYMRLLSPGFIAAFPNRILNIHPSLLPAFPGLDAQQQAFDYGVKIAGCTVHFVDEHLDHGAIILQRAIPVLETDDAHTLGGRILVEEHIAYTEAIDRVASGDYEIQGRRYVKSRH
jgi:phosphoribosylglycinamide formyltransferase 1